MNQDLVVDYALDERSDAAKFHGALGVKPLGSPQRHELGVRESHQAGASRKPRREDPPDVACAMPSSLPRSPGLATV